MLAAEAASPDVALGYYQQAVIVAEKLKVRLLEARSLLERVENAFWHQGLR